MSNHLVIPTFLKSVAVTLDVNRSAMVKNPVQNRRSDYRITENLTPISVRLIRSDFYRRLLVSPGNKLKETMGTLPVEGR